MLGAGAVEHHAILHAQVLGENRVEGELYLLPVRVHLLHGSEHEFKDIPDRINAEILKIVPARRNVDAHLRLRLADFTPISKPGTVTPVQFRKRITAHLAQITAKILLGPRRIVVQMDLLADPVVNRDFDMLIEERP